MMRTTNNLFKVICILFSNKPLTYHGIARKTKLSVMGVSKIIAKLTNEGIANVETVGKSKVPKLVLSRNNLEIFVLAERFKFSEFTNKHNNLRGFLLALRDSLDSDFSLIFGSYASAEEGTKSDLDLLIVSDKKNMENQRKIEAPAQYPDGRRNLQS